MALLANTPPASGASRQTRDAVVTCKPSPAVQSFLEALQSIGNDLDQLTRDSVFWSWTTREALAANVLTHIPVKRVEDIWVPARAHRIPIRLYNPATSNTLPALVFIHGGGWALGSIATYSLCRYLANGIPAAVISVDYRLAPENPFPAAVHDVYMVLQWVGSHATEVAGDTKRLVIAGDSAGGNLATVAALITKQRGGVPIAYQVLFYPSTDISRTGYPSYKEFGTGHQLTRRAVESFRKFYLPRRQDWTNPYASPLRAPDLQGLPRTLIVAAGCDPLRDEGKEYADRLRAAGVDVTYVLEPDMIHGFLGFFNYVPSLSLEVQRRLDGYLSLMRQALR
jgi:acetyl esterase